MCYLLHFSIVQKLYKPKEWLQVEQAHTRGTWEITGQCTKSRCENNSHSPSELQSAALLIFKANFISFIVYLPHHRLLCVSRVLALTAGSYFLQKTAQTNTLHPTADF